jgi:hypothetical protein
VVAMASAWVTGSGAGSEGGGGASGGKRTMIFMSACHTKGSSEGGGSGVARRVRHHTRGARQSRGPERPREPAQEASQEGCTSRRWALIEPEDALGPPTTPMHAHIRGDTCAVSLRCGASRGTARARVDVSTRVVTYATVHERVSERGVSGRVWQRYYRRIRKSRPTDEHSNTRTRPRHTTRPYTFDLVT